MRPASFRRWEVIVARAKRASDDIYNARRRIRRAAKAAERKGETERARQLRMLVESTYIGRGAGANVARAASAAIAALKKIPQTREEKRAERERRREVRDRKERNARLISALRSAARNTAGPGGAAKKLTRAFLARDNAIFAHELNLASSDNASSLDKPEISGKSQARIFWMSTRKLWMDARPENRYREIMKAMGTDSLRLAFARVLRYNEEALASAMSAEKEVRDTLREMGDERGDEPVSIGSPPEFMYFVKDYSALVNLMR